MPTLRVFMYLKPRTWNDIYWFHGHTPGLLRILEEKLEQGSEKTNFCFVLCFGMRARVCIRQCVSDPCRDNRQMCAWRDSKVSNSQCRTRNVIFSRCQLSDRHCCTETSAQSSRKLIKLFFHWNKYNQFCTNYRHGGDEEAHLWLAWNN